MYKKEYPPIFQDGFQEIAMWQLDKIFLDPFKDAEQRKKLIDRLVAYLHELEALEMDFEVWIDGSFATTKPDPEDVDLVLLVDREAVDSLSDKKATLFQDLIMNRETIKARYNCDVFFIDKNEKSESAKWQNAYGFDSKKINSKGIYKIKIKKNV